MQALFTSDFNSSVGGCETKGLLVEIFTVGEIVFELKSSLVFSSFTYITTPGINKRGNLLFWTRAKSNLDLCHASDAENPSGGRKASGAGKKKLLQLPPS
jgi:hypothetical protein